MKLNKITVAQFFVLLATAAASTGLSQVSHSPTQDSVDTTSQLALGLEVSHSQAPSRPRILSVEPSPSGLELELQAFIRGYGNMDGDSRNGVAPVSEATSDMKGKDQSLALKKEVLDFISKSIEKDQIVNGEDQPSALKKEVLDFISRSTGKVQIVSQSSTHDMRPMYAFSTETSKNSVGLNGLNRNGLNSKALGSLSPSSNPATVTQSTATPAEGGSSSTTKITTGTTTATLSENIRPTAANTDTTGSTTDTTTTQNIATVNKTSEQFNGHPASADDDGVEATSVSNALSATHAMKIVLIIGITAAGLLVVLLVVVTVCLLRPKTYASGSKTKFLNTDTRMWDPQLLRPSQKSIDNFIFDNPLPSISEMVKNQQNYECNV